MSLPARLDLIRLPDRAQPDERSAKWRLETHTSSEAPWRRTLAVLRLRRVSPSD